MIDDKSYIHIWWWMINELELKGNDLLVYAIIYSFTNGTKDHYFNWSLNYLAERTNSTERGIQKNLKNLIEKWYIKKEETSLYNVKIIRYRTKFQGVEQSSIIKEQSSWGVEQSSTNIQDIYTSDIQEKEIKEKFELFWKEFPHARKGKKQEAKNNFIKQDSEKVMEEIKLLNWKIKLWLQDAKYIPACERRIRDFVPTSDIIKKQVMEQIVAKHMEMEGMKERYPLLKQDFWEQTMNKLVMEYNNKHKTKLSFNY